VSELREALTSLRDGLTQMRRDRPQLLEYVETLRQELDAVAASRRGIRERLEGLYQSQRSAATLRDANLRKSRKHRLHE
jgi:hypothetical protein